ncbi:flagellin [Aureimonas phyllosphaerae]|uniref:Flagellin n=1 Tax=Aureimonas phyllosphaerae TaxID=1166078 RepID=A0A7W6FUG6_9HYPH|nr:flagellin [Aureimonas phyllosphaerae]MBB3936048.1 flagellin [Aureimonas phyllosphaerae]MBB3960227.1 flagellin [Aureimonas phyllosphaerae]SFF35334.1 flagellin [Aureimonas phyllosphaerae]
MTSINFNAAATSALRTLQSTNTSLNNTQNHISTGLKIGEAKDNAAYWSISTTMKSDNKSLSTVKDALGLGSATVDVAYQAMNAALDVLNEMKSKLTAATQDGVDKPAVQAELAELQKQLKSIASSATFSGENWLSVDSTSSNYSATKQVVSSYTRDASGAVSIGTISIDTSSMVLINNGVSKEGILDGGATGNTGTGGISAATSPTTGAGSATSGTDNTGAITARAATVAADAYSVVVKIDGVTKTFTGTLTGETFTAGAATATEIATAIKNKLTADSGFAALGTVDYPVAGTPSDSLTFTSRTTGANSKMEFTSLTIGGAAITTAGATGTDGVNAKVTAGAAFASANSLTLDNNDVFSFDITVDGGAATRVNITKDLVSSVLGTKDGKITTAGDFKTILAKAVSVAGLSNVVVDLTGSTITLQGGASSIAISNVNASKGADLTSYDITSSSKADLATLISTVNAAAKAITSAASTLGSVTARIDLQKTFVQNLMDTIDKGVSGLVDADMNEESTKLQALQVKQQLGVQALSIANQSAQNVLSLFRS